MVLRVVWAIECSGDKRWVWCLGHAKQCFPGQKSSLDILCERYMEIFMSHKDLYGVV